MDKVRPPAQKTKYKGYLGLWIYYGTWCLGVQGGCRWVNFGFGTLRRRHELCPLCLATQVSIIEDSACRVRIILTCLLNTVYPATIPIHHLG